MALQVGAMKGNLIIIMSIPVKYVLYNRDYDHHFGNLFIYLFIYLFNKAFSLSNWHRLVSLVSNSTVHSLEDLYSLLVT